MSSSCDHVSVTRLVPAPPEPILDLLADPVGHARIDGGGSVRAARSGGRRLALGDRFGMDMKLGVAYSTRNTVVEFEENRRIAWQTSVGGPLGVLSRPGVRLMEGMTRRDMAATLERIEEVVSGAAA